MPRTSPTTPAKSVPADIVAQEARALQALYTEYVERMKQQTRRRPSQAEIGESFGIGTQGMVWQYLNGTRPLGITAAEKFARGLGVSVEAFSPRLASIARRAAEVAGHDAAGEPSQEELANAILIVARALRGTDGPARDRAKNVIALLSKPAVPDLEVERRMPVTKARKTKGKP